MSQQVFGGAHTIKKLAKLEAYLKAYLNVFKNQSWVQTIYIDAFAGTGIVPAAASDLFLPLDEDGRACIIGSARRALGLDSSFGEYVFVEKTRKKTAELDRLKSEYPGKADRIMVVRADANRALQELCVSRDWKR